MFGSGPQRRVLTAATWAIVAAMLSVTAAASGQEQQTSVVVPDDPLFEWAKRINLAATILAAVVSASTLVLLRRRLAELRAKQLLFVSLCALPLPATFMTSAIGLTQSKAVNFCRHCHEMAPFIRDLEDSESETLAALHFRNRYIQHNHCYTCHSDYGVFGDVKAKTAGFQHLYKHATKSAKLPIRKADPYNFGICLGCHQDSQLYKESHEAMTEEELKTCTSGACHELAHPPPDERAEE